MVIAVTLAGAIVVAMTADNLLELFQYIISVPAIFGASIWLGFVWRRVTKWAVIWQVAVCLLLYAAIPTAFQRHRCRAAEPGVAARDGAAAGRRRRRLPRTDDVTAGSGRPAPGELVTRSQIDAADRAYSSRRSCPIDPDDPQSAKRRPRPLSRGALGDELVRRGLHAAGPSPSWSPRRFYFDALFPFLALVVLSWFTRPEPREALDRFFAKVHTPVQPTREAEHAALESARANPRQFDSDKVFKGENWEILKPARSDYIGFFGTWALVGVVILLLWAMVTVR